MKIPKAIEILELELPEYLSNPQTDLMHAIKLGREALERVGEMRSWPNHIAKEPLPGETKD